MIIWPIYRDVIIVYFIIRARILRSLFRTAQFPQYQSTPFYLACLGVKQEPGPVRRWGWGRSRIGEELITPHQEHMDCKDIAVPTRTQ